MTRRYEGGGLARVREELRAAAGPCVATVGTFDGVHRGHRLLVAEARRRGEARSLAAVAVTFDPRPERFFRPGSALPDICDIDERVERLRRAGADRVAVVSFSDALADLSAGDFMALMVQELRMHELCVGRDFALGRGREGTPEQLRADGFEVATVDLLPSATAPEKASSTNVRRLIASGMAPGLALSNA